MTPNSRIDALRAVMKAQNIDMYYVPTADFHSSEYAGEYFQCRKWLSGFTGSAGSLIITRDEAILWTDGRYFIQAEQQLKGSCIELYKSGEPNVPSIFDYIVKNIQSGQTIGMDGKTVTVSWLEMLKRRLGKRPVNINTQCDLTGLIWHDRPELSCRPIWELDTVYAGLSRRDKLAQVRTELKKSCAEWLLISTLDDIAWLLNLRGNDTEYNPVFLSYMLISSDRAVLFVQSKALSDDLRSRLISDGIEINDYNEINSALSSLSNCIIQLDRAKTSCALTGCLSKSVKILPKPSPTTMLKACKNPTEIENIRLAHKKDAAAIIQFLHWLKDNVSGGNITEISAAEQLEQFRKQQEHYIEPSFAPISAYAEHGAVVHYSATEETNSVLKPEGFLLLDTGGQYLEGTTDITRTIALGALTEDMKRNYTAVLSGNLRLASAVFLSGCTGVNLDILARQPLWERGLNFNHGTGHGVGFLLCCHEGPQNIHWRMSPNNSVLREGMVTSDEPGIYIEGEYGIRLENLLLCRKHESNCFGDFLCFDTLTLVPFDLDAIVPEQMTENDKSLLNAYHRNVYEQISPLLDEADRLWLKNAVREI